MNVPGSLIPWQTGENVLRFLPDGRIYAEKVTEGVHFPPKRVGIKDLETVFSSSYVTTWPCLEDRPGVLPKGTVECLGFVHDEQVGRAVVMFREKCVRPFRFFREDTGETLEMDVGYPRLLFRYLVFNGRVGGLFVRAVKDDKIKDDTELFFYPYTNVDQTTGAVCMGNYAYPPVKELRNLESFPEVFYDLPNLLHHYRGKMPLKDLLELNREKEFDDSLLEPCGEKYEEFATRGLHEAPRMI